MKHHARIALFGLVGVLLVGCGGGGGGSGANPVTAEASIAITGNNAAQVSGTVVETALSADELSAGNTLVGVVIEGDAPRFDLSEFISEQIGLFELLQSSVVSDAIVGVVIPSERFDCSIDGFLELSGDIADETFSSISVRDRFNLAFTGCDEGEGVVLNGAFNMEFTAIEGDLFSGMPPYSFSVAVDIRDFVVTSMGETFAADGDVLLAISTQDDVKITTVLSGISLAVTVGGEMSTLTDYSITEVLDSSTGAYLTTANGTFSNSRLGGKVTFITVASFEGLGDDLPASGEMLITGANGSSVRVIADGSGIVTLRIDVNGNGEPDEILATTWAEMTGP